MHAKRDSVVVSKLYLLKDSMYKNAKEKKKGKTEKEKAKGENGKQRKEKEIEKIGFLGETQTRLERYI